MKVGSLFSGIGGLDLGLERAGMTVAWQSEIDPYACRVLAKHWPNVPNLGDITKIDWSNVEPIDVICGGYPCQPFSSAGVRRGESDARHLWPHFAEALRVVRPRFAVLENVPGHLSLGFGRVLGDLADLGYDTEWDCIPAAAVGAPHLRYRVFVVAHMADTPQLLGNGGSDNPGSDQAGTRPVPESGDRRDDAGTVGHPDITSPHTLTTKGSPRPAASESGWWTFEPDVGRVAHGISAVLDCIGGGLNAHESCIQKGRTAGVPTTATLSKVRLDAEHPAPPSRSQRCALCGVPMSAVPRHRRSGTWEVGTWAEKAKGVRRVRLGVHELHAHQSQDVREGVSVGDWQAERLETVAHRVDRLRALGNAVVPQVAEFVGRRLMDAAA